MKYTTEVYVDAFPDLRIPAIVDSERTWNGWLVPTFDLDGMRELMTFLNESFDDETQLYKMREFEATNGPCFQMIDSTYEDEPYDMIYADEFDYYHFPAVWCWTSDEAGMPDYELRTLVEKRIRVAAILAYRELRDEVIPSEHVADFDTFDGFCVAESSEIDHVCDGNMLIHDAMVKAFGRELLYRCGPDFDSFQETYELVKDLIVARAKKVVIDHLSQPAV